MSAPETLDERYFLWLCRNINPRRRRAPKMSHWLLCEQLYKKPFEWFVPNDDNRAEDGRLLREDFISDSNEIVDPNWMDLDCSMLELILAIAHRASFETYVASDVWFWEIITNLDLVKYTDDKYDEQEVNYILETINRRLYEPDGHGGLFPLKDPGKDQRKVEIWYQMSAYLLENDLTS